jgi:hypothetical protein
MKLKQLPFLASALALVAGLYALGGPFREERSSLLRIAPLAGLLVLYEALVIGAIALLRRRGVPAGSLRLIAVFFLLDPVFLGDAFASLHPAASLAFNGVSWLCSLGLAWGLARASAFTWTPWQAGWTAAALGFIHLSPTLIAGSAVRPAPWFLAATLAASALAVPLLRRPGLLGAAFVAAFAVHLGASALVAGLRFDAQYLYGPLASASCLLPWPRLGWTPLALGAAVSPLREKGARLLGTTDGLGVLLVVAAFLLLGAGLLASLRPDSPRAVRVRRVT